MCLEEMGQMAELPTPGLSMLIMHLVQGLVMILEGKPTSG